MSLADCRSTEQLSVRLREAIFDVQMPLQTTKTLDASAFERLNDLVNQLAQLLRGSIQLPRKIVNELYGTAKALENEAPHSKDPRVGMDWSAKLFLTFDLIMLGESHDDRKPGVPRVR